MKRIAFVLAGLFVLSLAIAPASVQAQDVQKAYQGPEGLSNSVTFGGYFEHEFEDKENKQSEFDNHRTILFFGAQPHERLKFFNELEMEHGIGSIKLEQSWLEFAINDNHNFRGGIDLMPMGRRNVNHDGNLRDFVFRPYSSGRLIPTTWFESGLSFNGSLPGNLSYNVGVSNGMRPSSNVGERGEFESMVGTSLAGGDTNNAKATYGRLAWSPVLGTEIGLSAYNSNYAPDKSITYSVLDFNTIQGPFEFTGEYINIDKDQQTASGLKGASGGNIEAAYHFFPNFLRDSFIARGFDNPTFTALARYEQLNYDQPSGATPSLDESYTSIGFNYRPIEQAAFKFSYDMENRDGVGEPENDRFAYGMVIGF